MWYSPHPCIGSLRKILKCVLTPCQANNMSLIVNSEICFALLWVHASVKTDCFFRTFENLVAIRFSLSSSALRPSLKVAAICWKEKTILPLIFYVNCITFFPGKFDKNWSPLFSGVWDNRKFSQPMGWVLKKCPAPRVCGFSSLCSSCFWK